MKQTVLIINDYCHVTGGAAAVAIESAIALADHGMKVRFLGAVGPIDKRLARNAEIDVRCANLEVFLDARNRPKAVVDGLWSGPAYRFIADNVADLDPRLTLAHVHGWVKAFSPSIFRALRRHGMRTIVTLHDYFIACPNGGFLDYRRVEICKRAPLSVSCVACNCDSRSFKYKLWRVGRDIVQKHLLKLPSSCDGFIAVSEFARVRLAPYLGSRAITRVIRNPIVAPRPNEPRQVAEDAPLLFVGRLSPEKGPALLAQAATRIGRKAVFLGDGPLRAALIEQYPGFEFRGWAGSEEVIATMRRAALLVFPSLWYETNGLVIAEAMSQGLTPVVADGTAGAELIRDGQTGWKFKMGDLDSLEMTIRSALAAPDVGDRAAAEYWANPWSPESHAVALQEFYAEINRRRTLTS